MVAAEQANMATATETIVALNAEITELKAKTALPIAAPPALDADNMGNTETLATAKTSWDLQLEAARNKFK
jgi:FtsZ-binding cell division protein ZapB